MKKIIGILILMLAFNSCTDLFSDKQLNQAPDSDINFDKVFGDYNMFKGYADQNYSYMIGHYSYLFNAMQAGMSDECRNDEVNTATSVINTGSWNGSVPSSNSINAEISDPWANSYKGIRKSCLIIENIDLIPNFPSPEIKNRCLGEAYFLRAMFYFQLTKRWGAVPLVTHSLVPGVDQLDLPRNTYDECVDFMVEDCDKAASLLPLKYDNPDADNGRATVGAAKALKARLLLYAARPLHNPENDISKWTKARDAAMDVIKMNQYSLYSDYKNLFFQTACNEIILNRPRAKMNAEQGNTNGSTFFTRFILTPGAGNGGWFNTTVTQNFVDKFEDNKGYPIDKSKIYNEQDPYSNRDPRLKMEVLVDGMYYSGKNVDFTTSVDASGKTTGAHGRDRQSRVNANPYAIAKLWQDGFARYGGKTQYLDYIFFRYGEVLLNFAEAQNEIGGPESAYNGLSVREALTQLRARAGQVSVPIDISNTIETMRERIHNERAVELAFEDHRWYDVLSWKRGQIDFAQPIIKMTIDKYPDGTKKYVRSVRDVPIFNDYMNLYPIPQTEVDKSGVLVQNPGWEVGAN